MFDMTATRCELTRLKQVNVWDKKIYHHLLHPQESPSISFCMTAANVNIDYDNTSIVHVESGALQNNMANQQQ